MSFALDVNVLLYASDAESPFHGRASELVKEWVRKGEVFYLAWPTLMAYLRMATHPSIFAAPLTPEAARANVVALLRLPHVRTLSEADGFWECYQLAIRGHAIRGNLVPDAHLAALLLQHGVRKLYSNDGDFRRFEFLEVVNPFATPP